ncbi:hypothetical protein [uncultured Sneathia sp.]|uniref:hypothetical protein n=1 Tax=uncultured Sneathia sp. TaxID=278067 RepID=UPI002591615F|nr:hypothetical protein [uncultured Sneathia sp.]
MELKDYIEYRKVFIIKFLNSNLEKINYGIDENLENINKYFKKKLNENEIKLLKKFEKEIDEKTFEKFVILEDGFKISWNEYLNTLKEKINFLWENDKEEIIKYLTEDERKNINVGNLKKKLFELFLINSNELVVDIYNFPINKNKIIYDFDKKIIMKEKEI